MAQGKKKLRINSISSPDIKRILKPCEARAGHGCISVAIGLTFIIIVVLVVVKYGKKLIDMIF